MADCSRSASQTGQWHHHWYAYSVLSGLPAIRMVDPGCGHWRIEPPSREGYFDLVHHGRADHAGYTEASAVLEPRTSGPRVIRRWWWETTLRPSTG